MTRLPRVVVPGVPHHVTQRGARRMPVFFSEADYRLYLRLLREQSSKHGLEIWAYCLMPNHVHLIAVPSSKAGLARSLGEAHRRFAVLINRREGWQGHLWQERFHSFPMDEPHLLAAVRYVLLNPVRGGLTDDVLGWPHSSARAHLGRENNALIVREPVDDRVSDWPTFLATGESQDEAELIRRHSRVGRPLGKPSFLRGVEQMTGNRLPALEPGRPRHGGKDPVTRTAP